MAYYQFTRSQKFNADVKELWSFIAAPQNLREITPDFMGFEITSGNLEEKMYPGMIISYKVSPLPGIRMNWLTEITQVAEGSFFIDEQRMGPYKMWHHQHLLVPIDNGVLMKDIVTYIPPFGWLGAIANSLFIRRQLDRIFKYRQEKMEQLFGRYQPAPAGS